jgi:hypothetical protein
MMDDDKVALPAYFQIADAPGLLLFRCGKLRSTLTTRACAANYRRAQKLRPDEVTGVHLCRDCPLGAHHLGVPFVRRSGLHGKSICPRCRRHSERIINGTRCISCYNREAEWVRGFNAKHTQPRMAPLEARRIRIILNGQATELRAERTRDAAEMVLGVLRVAAGRVVFCRPCRGASVALVDWIAEQQPKGDQHDRMSPSRQRERAAHATVARHVMAPEAIAELLKRRSEGIAQSRQHTAREART